MADQQVSKLSKPTKVTTKDMDYKQREQDLQAQIQGGMTRDETRNVFVRNPDWDPSNPFSGPIGSVQKETYQVIDPEMQKVAKQSEQQRLQRELDLLRGEQRGERFFGEGSMGRIGEGRAGEVQDILSQYRQQATQGLDAPVLQAEREARLAGLARGEQAQQRQLRASQAASGVTGGLAQAQMLRQQEQQQAGRQQAERQLLLDSEQRKTQALGALERGTQYAREEELGREKFNLEQQRRELQGRLTSMYGEAALGVAERTSAASAAAAKEYARASANAGGGGKK